MDANSLGAIQQVLDVLNERHQGHVDVTVDNGEFVRVHDSTCGIGLMFWFDGDVQPDNDSMQAARQAATTELVRRHPTEYGRLVEAEIKQSIGRQLISLGLARPII